MVQIRLEPLSSLSSPHCVSWATVHSDAPRHPVWRCLYLPREQTAQSDPRRWPLFCSSLYVVGFVGMGGFASWSHAPKPGFWNWNFQHKLECSVFALVWNSVPVWKDKSLWSELEGGWCHWIKPRTPSCSYLGTVILGEILQFIQQGSLPPKMPSFSHLRNIFWALMVLTPGIQWENWDMFTVLRVPPYPKWGEGIRNINKLASPPDSSHNAETPEDLQGGPTFCGSRQWTRIDLNPSEPPHYPFARLLFLSLCCI